MDVEQLRQFVEVVEQASFAGAARVLDIAPSVVTRGVAALEEELGVRLLNRTTRRVSLTDAGQAYFEQVRPLLGGLHRAAEEARQRVGQVMGTVKITASVALGQTILVPLLPKLRERFPALSIELLLTDAIVDLIADRVDIALRLGPPDDSSLVGMQLARIRYRVCASPEYLRLHGRPRVPADLRNCDCVRFPLPGFRSQWKFLAEGGEPEPVDVDGWLTISNALALRQAALDGLGPVLLPQWLTGKDLMSGALVDLFPDREVSAANFDSALWLLFPTRDHLPVRVRSVVDLLKAHVPLAHGLAKT